MDARPTSARGYRLGETAVAVAAPVVEPVVGGWRERFDPSGAAGMPAHVTVLAPFLDAERLDDEVLGALGELCGGVLAFELVFARTARFPGTLWLDPAPAEPLRELTLAIAERWPEAPPYGGAHDDVVPHLTVACAEEAVLDEIEPELRARLPLTATVDEARLYAFDGTRWQPRASFPFTR